MMVLPQSCVSFKVVVILPIAYQVQWRVEGGWEKVGGGWVTKVLSTEVYYYYWMVGG
jgi:hypothetical protein